MYLITLKDPLHIGVTEKGLAADTADAVICSSYNILNDTVFMGEGGVEGAIPKWNVLGIVKQNQTK